MPLRRLVAVLALLAVAAPSAVADPWGDAQAAFRRAQREEDWKERRGAYAGLAFFDGPAAVDEAVRSMAQEQNPAVVIGAIETLGQLISDGARTRLVEAMQKSQGETKFHLLLAISRQRDDHGKAALLEVLGDPKDLPSAAQALLALGQKRVTGALDAALPFLRHKDWHLRVAAARAVLAILGPPPDPPADPKAPPAPWLPEGLDVQAATVHLVEALEAADGAERGPLLAALTRITKQDLGYDPAAWKALASGTEPSEIRANPARPPYFFGLPVWGTRVVMLTSTNLRSDKPVPFTDRERLRELCEVPGGRPIAWMRIQTNRQFMDAWILRTVEDMVRIGGVRLELISAGTRVESAFGKLASASASTQTKLEKMIGKFAVEHGNDTYGALNAALDISGSRDSAAWGQGPDQVLLSTCAIPWLAEVTDQEVVGAGIGLKAARRLVTVHAVGLDEHPYEMLKQIARLTGGTYLTLER